MRILAIDDDQDILNSVSLAFDLYWAGSRVFTAHNGAEGVRIIEHQSLDLVILDLGLPDVEGLELCQQIREVYGTPVIILTVKDRVEDVLEGLGAGATDYMTKPFSPKELVARVWAVARGLALPSATDEAITPLVTEG